MTESDKVRSVLERHPELSVAEDVVEACRAEGFEIGPWSAYFAARDLGRHLNRRNMISTKKQELRERAFFFLLMHGSLQGAITTLNRLDEMLKSGHRVECASDKRTGESSLELTVARELVDAAGGVAQACRLVACL